MIVIIGNGPIGLITERICQLKNIPYTLIGRKTAPKNHKLILLTYKNIRFLESLGFQIPVSSFYDTLTLSHHLCPLPIQIQAKTYQSPYLCAGVWSKDLLSILAKHSNPSYCNILETPSPSRIVTDQGILTPSSLICADGSPSIGTRMATISYQKRPAYHCVIIPANIDSDHLIQRYQRNYIAAAIPGERGAIILSSHHPLNHIEFNQDHLSDILKIPIHSCSDPIFQTITPAVASNWYQDNVMLLGNAALSIEPVSAQGLNHALNILSKLNTFSPSEDFVQTIQKKHHRLFNQMQWITNMNLSGKLLQTAAFYSQVATPFFQDCIYQFGNQYD